MERPRATGSRKGGNNAPSREAGQAVRILEQRHAKARARTMSGAESQSRRGADAQARSVASDRCRDRLLRGIACRPRAAVPITSEAGIGWASTLGFSRRRQAFHVVEAQVETTFSRAEAAVIPSVARRSASQAASSAFVRTGAGARGPTATCGKS
jgi:hypothetical protein